MVDKALLMGVNTYKSISSLRGCENDVHNMDRLLTETFGFRQNNIRKYLSANVTMPNVDDGFKWLLGGAQVGDRLVFHFAGHGSYVEGSEEESDFTDELICLYDMDFDDPTTYLIDNDLGRRLDAVPKGVRFTVVLDSCHSGTGTRYVVDRQKNKAENARNPLNIDRDMVTRQFNRGIRQNRGITEAFANPPEEERVLARFCPPIDGGMRPRDRSPLRKIGLNRTTARAVALNHQLLAASADFQTSADAYIDNNYCGAFTYYLCQTIRNSAPQATVLQIMDTVTKTLKNAAFTQTPQNEGPWPNDRPFGPVGTPSTGEVIRPPEIIASEGLVAQITGVAKQLLDIAENL